VDRGIMISSFYVILGNINSRTTVQKSDPSGQGY